MKIVLKYITEVKFLLMNSDFWPLIIFPRVKFILLQVFEFFRH